MMKLFDPEWYSKQILQVKVDYCHNCRMIKIVYIIKEDVVALDEFGRVVAHDHAILHICRKCIDRPQM